MELYLNLIAFMSSLPGLPRYLLPIRNDLNRTLFVRAPNGRADISSSFQHLGMRIAVVVPVPGRDYHVPRPDSLQKRLAAGRLRPVVTGLVDHGRQPYCTLRMCA